MDPAGIWDPVQRKGFRSLELSKSHATLCNQHQQISKKLLMRNRPEVKCSSKALLKVISKKTYESLHLIHHGKDYNLDFAAIIRPCLELIIFKVGVLWSALFLFVSLQLDNGKDTQAYIYALHSNIEYEVRVRSKMRGYNFGVFSDSILILIPNIGLI